VITTKLEWHAVTDCMPDADMTVICWLTGDEWFSGWWDGACWRDTDTGTRLEVVTHWAEPVGPT
jgi:hypothetical protein